MSSALFLIDSTDITLKYHLQPSPFLQVEQKHLPGGSGCPGKSHHVSIRPGAFDKNKRWVIQLRRINELALLPDLKELCLTWHTKYHRFQARQKMRMPQVDLRPGNQKWRCLLSNPDRSQNQNLRDPKICSVLHPTKRKPPADLSTIDAEGGFLRIPSWRSFRNIKIR